MKNIRIYLNLYIIIPLIFGGFSILSLLVAHRLTRHYLDLDIPPGWPLAFWGSLLFVFTVICGLLVVKFIIKPMDQFVDRTKTMGVLDGVENEAAMAPPNTELHHYTRVFDQVSEILSKVKARQLFPDIIGQSTAMRGVLNQIIKVAPIDSTVLVMGETGTGKELVAHSIHRHSRRQSRPFIALNCAAIPEGLLESELFGHEKGAFTGAVARKAGKIESAHEGTLFLDEVGDMPLETQAKLLRAIEEKTIVRLGGTHPIKIDVRIITATNKNLPELVKIGTFRQDLFYRLNVVMLQLPPLRERREDIPLLADHFISRFVPDKRLSSAVVQLLMAHDWPGNVRELQNTIQSAGVMAADDTLLPSHLPGYIFQSQPRIAAQPSMVPISQTADLDANLREFEKNMIIQALSQCNGIQKLAAELLQIKERSLWHRLKKYEIDATAFKTAYPNKHK